MNSQTGSEPDAIIVVGASAGGVQALINLVGQLPEDLPAAVLIVIHLAPQSPSVLPRILSRSGPLPAVHPEDRDPLRRGTIYVASPNHHLLVETGRVRVTSGLQENRHRPAVDPLFRSAARAYGPNVIGVVLSGSGDDGTAGLGEITRQGGAAVVQSPETALCSGMPRSAFSCVKVDHCVPLGEMGPVLARLCAQARDRGAGHRRAEWEVRSTEELSVEPGGTMATLEANLLRESPGGFSCPQCGSPLRETQVGPLLRFRCRVGHAYTASSLSAAKREGLELTLWAAVNELKEGAALAARMAERARKRGHPLTAQRHVDRAEECQRHALVLVELLNSTHVCAPELATIAAMGPGAETAVRPTRKQQSEVRQGSR